VERVASRYAPAGGATPIERSRFHYVRTKLLGDPVARLVADAEGERAGALGDLLDIGTGRGQLPILLVELGRATRALGIDWDDAKVEAGVVAARIEPPLAVELAQGDARTAPYPPADTVLLIDLLHYFAIEEQDAILRRAALAVRAGGRLLVREADTERGLRSAVTLLEERVFTALRFNRGERVRFRPAREIVALLESLGLACEVRPAWGSTPFSNVIIIGRRPAI
jgi:SAM-dependent methyltransferase